MSDEEIVRIIEQKNKGDSDFMGSFEAVNKALGKCSFENNRIQFTESDVTLFYYRHHLYVQNRQQVKFYYISK